MVHELLAKMQNLGNDFLYSEDKILGSPYQVAFIVSEMFDEKVLVLHILNVLIHLSHCGSRGLDWWGDH